MSQENVWQQRRPDEVGHDERKWAKGKRWGEASEEKEQRRHET